MQFDYQPIIIVGAARSGTKLLRDLIAQNLLVDKVPYDINYIWRLGNDHIPHDELTPDMLDPQIALCMRHEINKFHKSHPFLIEKTVSNTLRVPYVQAVFPNAFFIHLIRDGYDVVESAFRQWTAPPDWRYIWRKAKTFPITKAFSYGMTYGSNVIKKMVISDSGRTGTWGPRYKDIEVDVASKSLIEVCALQWSYCVQKCVHDLEKLSSDRVFTLYYEDFVQDPICHLEKIVDFVGLGSPESYRHAVDVVTLNNMGKGKNQLDLDQFMLISPIVEKVWESHKLARYQ